MLDALRELGCIPAPGPGDTTPPLTIVDITDNDRDLDDAEEIGPLGNLFDTANLFDTGASGSTASSSSAVCPQSKQKKHTGALDTQQTGHAVASNPNGINRIDTYQKRCGNHAAPPGPAPAATLRTGPAPATKQKTQAHRGNPKTDVPVDMPAESEQGTSVIREDVAIDGRAGRFRKGLVQCLEECTCVIERTKDVFAQLDDESDKIAMKKTLALHKADLLAERKKLGSYKDRETRVNTSTLVCAKVELAAMRTKEADITAILDLFAVWLKEPICPQEWIAKIEALETRGFPMQSPTIMCVTHEMQVSVLMLHNKVSGVSIHATCSALSAGPVVAQCRSYSYIFCHIL